MSCISMSVYCLMKDVITIGVSSGSIIGASKTLGRVTNVGIYNVFEGSFSLFWSTLLVLTMKIDPYC